MKKFIVLITASFVTATVLLLACQTPEEKVETAQDKVETATENLKTAQTEADSAAIKAAAEKEWLAFKMEAEEKITKTEVQIAALKEKLKSNNKEVKLMYGNRIDSLEKKNQDLKTRINAYNNQSNWSLFKTEFNQDMERLGEALKGFVVKEK
jgi:chromosome segregation ATPase